MSTDWTKPSWEIIKDLVSAANPAFEPVRNSFDVIGLTDNYDPEIERNARVTVTPKAGSGYDGDVNVFYNRVAPNAFADTLSPEPGMPIVSDVLADLDIPADQAVDLTTPEGMALLVEAIKLTTNLTISASDILPGFSTLAKNSKSDGVNSFVYYINAYMQDCPLFRVGVLGLVVEQRIVPVETSTIISNSVLDGLVVPVVTP